MCYTFVLFGLKNMFGVRRKNSKESKNYSVKKYEEELTTNKKREGVSGSGRFGLVW